MQDLTLCPLNELHKAVCEGINDLQDVRAGFPASWFSIKDRLSGMQENYLSLDRYRELCRQQGEQDEKAQDNLAGFLHRLGIALHYRDDPRLGDTSILNPHWVTNGIYRFLNAEKLKENKGILQLKDLQELLPAAHYPLEKHEFLLELMRKFNLCFAFPDDPQHRYLVPELLDIQEPPLPLGERFDPKECLNFEYHYKILPEGLLPNFIVRTHILSTNQPRWHNGVVLVWEGCHALVKADAADRKVTIRLQGPSAEGRRRLLAVIRSDFERIHNDIPKLEVISTVPVPDYPNVALEYKKLCAFEKAGEIELKEYVDGEIVKLNIRDLLNGVDLAGTRFKEQQFERGPALLKLFYSYSHKDETLRDELETHLKLLQRQGEIFTWHDRKILGGDEWKGKIDENLEAADIVLLLVSADFLASDYCYDIEMKHALKRREAGQVRVIPVILRDCDWNHAPFGKLQALPENGNPVTLWTNKDTAWKDVAQGIRQVVRELRERKAE